MGNQWTMELAFDLAAGIDPSLSQPARQLQIGGLYCQPSGGQLTQTALCSLAGLHKGDSLTFLVFDLTDSGRDDRNITSAKLKFFTPDYKAVDSEKAIGGTVTEAAILGPTKSQFFGVSINAYRLYGEGTGSTFTVGLSSYRLFAHFLMEVANPPPTGTVAYFGEGEVFMN